MKNEQFLKKSKVVGLPKIFLNNASGEAIQHPLNGAIIAGHEPTNLEDVTTNGKVTDHLVFINRLAVVINNEHNQKVSQESEFETFDLSGANFDEDVIIDVKSKGVTQDKLFLKSKVQALTDEQLEAERSRVERIEASVYPQGPEESFMPFGDEGADNDFFGYDVTSEDIAEPEEVKPQPVSVLDKTIETKEEAVLFIQEALGVFDDDDVSNLLHKVRGQRVPDAAAVIVDYSRKNGQKMAELIAVNNFKKQLRELIGVNEPGEVIYERG